MNTPHCLDVYDKVATMPGDRVTSYGGRRAGARPGRAAACVRAGLFALVGSTLAALGHHAVAEGAVPWRLVIVFTLGQFALVRPVARRRLSLPAVVTCTVVAQAALHLALTSAGSAHHPDSAHAGHTAEGHIAHQARGDGHAWHHASAAMAAAHLAAALAAGWLLHRADAAVTAALAAVRTLRRVAAVAATRLVPRLRTAEVTAPPMARLVGRFELPSAAWTYTLEHTLVRRGPPGRAHVPHRPLTRAAASARPASPARSSPCPHTTAPSSRAASRSAVPPR
ncbi:hypothetical protein [Streptomyces sp. HD]|uniref:hypothetical protein n=1 Tax=Streptomyces sp. HD TaxID=3020892 RepID=UPI00232BF0A1|nr:hypothetical protein [Streptomyces sp. HD]MDC0767170.1 hypothetical protein [Streptomyces sp. HD]